MNVLMKSRKSKNNNSTYEAEIPQCLPAMLKPVSATERPISMMVGATVRGPINLSSTLTRPDAPIRISRMAATMMDPVICGCVMVQCVR